MSDRFLEARWRTWAESYARSVSYFSFPIIYWQDFDMNVTRLCAQYSQLLVGLFAYNYFLTMISETLSDNTDNRARMSYVKNGSFITFDRGSSTIGGKDLSGAFTGGVDESLLPVVLSFPVNRYVRKEQRGVDITHGEEDDPNKGLAFKDNRRDTRQDKYFQEKMLVLMTIGADVHKMKHDFTATLNHDLYLSDRTRLNVFKTVTAGALAVWRRMWSSFARRWAKQSKVLEPSVYSEVFSKRLFGSHDLSTRPDLMTYVMVDASQLSMSAIDSLTNIESLTNLSKLGWTNFILYYPDLEQCIFLTRVDHFSYTLSSEFGTNPFGITKKTYDIRHVNLGILRNFGNTLNKGVAFSQEDLMKLNKIGKELGMTRGFKIIRGLSK